jgi:hypothetical protein
MQVRRLTESARPQIAAEVEHLGGALDTNEQPAGGW